MQRAREAASGAVLAERLRPAHTHWTRLKGLLGTRSLEPGDGLWLKPCNQVHMIGMRYAIDVVFLDDDSRVVRTLQSLRPGRISPRVRAAASVLELPAGTLARVPLAEGARVAIEGKAEAGPASRVEALGALACNLILAVLFAFFAYAHFAVARRTGQWAATMPLVVLESVLVVLFLIRRRSIASSARPFDWAVAVAGTFLPLFLRPADQAGPLLWLGQPVQIAGATLAVVATVFLGRSYALVAANRGIKTTGGYRVVRHPIYAAYMLSYFGYLISYPAPRNGLIVAVTLAVLTARALVEERFLVGDPAYRQYLEHVRWRFVPYVY